MVQPPATHSGISIMYMEGGLTMIAVAVAFWLPQLGSAWFSRVESAFTRLARRKGLSVLVVGLTGFLLRLAILPLCPMPHPFSPDGYSFMLSADTFASGRLTNPTPALWTHFEAVHVTMTPTYQSMYFPAQGLVMAAGKVLTGEPWLGLLAVTALMSAAICWMLQAWLPPSWALLGGLLAVLRIGLFSYWIDSYAGAGSITALGGALVLGGLPRFMKTVRLRYALLMAVGFVLLGICRPLEGLLLAIPVTVALARWALFGKNRPTAVLLVRRTALPLALIVCGGVWMGYYNYRAFGSPTTLPYTIDRAQYAIAPYFIWQPQRPEPAYRHALMREFYHKMELPAYTDIHSVKGFVPQTVIKIARGVLFFTGIALLPPLIMFRRLFLDRRIRFLIWCLVALAAGQAIQIFLIPHYLAAFTAAFYAIGLQAMRHLRVWRPEGQPVGRTMVRLTVALCVVLGGVRVFAEPLRFHLAVWPAVGISGWVGPSSLSGAERVKVEDQLEKLPGKQLAIVRYSPTHAASVTWVYNCGDLNRCKVIWAWDMGDAENQELINHYNDRTVWLVEPDTEPVTVAPYKSPEQLVGAAR